MQISHLYKEIKKKKNTTTRKHAALSQCFYQQLQSFLFSLFTQLITKKDVYNWNVVNPNHIFV